MVQGTTRRKIAGRMVSNRWFIITRTPGLWVKLVYLSKHYAGREKILVKQTIILRARLGFLLSTYLKLNGILTPNT